MAGRMPGLDEAAEVALRVLWATALLAIIGWLAKRGYDVMGAGWWGAGGYWLAAAVILVLTALALHWTSASFVRIYPAPGANRRAIRRLSLKPGTQKLGLVFRFNRPARIKAIDIRLLKQRTPKEFLGEQLRRIPGVPPLEDGWDRLSVGDAKLGDSLMITGGGFEQERCTSMGRMKGGYRWKLPQDVEFNRREWILLEFECSPRKRKGNWRISLELELKPWGPTNWARLNVAVRP